jgi:hypothetical protein
MACAFRSLLQAERAGEAGRVNKYLRSVFAQVIGPLGAAILFTIAASRFGGSWNEARGLIFGDFLKACSLLVIGYHTTFAIEDITRLASNAKRRAIRVYRSVILLTVCVSFFLAIHIYSLGRSDSWASNPWAFGLVAVFSCAYLFLFFWGNLLFVLDNPENWGITKFATAFMLGANLPFMLASVAIGFIAFLSWWHDFAPQPETFLVGAVTFLVFSSTAANIFIDGFARPFLAVGCQAPALDKVQCAHPQPEPTPAVAAPHPIPAP